MGVVGADYLPPHRTVDTLYCLFGNNTKIFYEYLCDSNTWSWRPANPEVRVGVGSGLAYGSLRQDYWLGKGMWAFFGNNTETFGFFYPYDNPSKPEGGGQSFPKELGNPSLKILLDQKGKYMRFYLPNSHFDLEIYDNLGKVIYRVSVQEEAKWDYRNFSSGVYFYHLKSPTFSHTGKMIITK